MANSDRPSSYVELVAFDTCKDILKDQGGVLCNEAGVVFPTNYIYLSQKSAHHDEVSCVYDNLHHVVISLLSTGTAGRGGTPRDIRARKREELCSLLQNQAIHNASRKYEGKDLDLQLPRVERSDKERLHLLISDEGREQLLDTLGPETKLQNVRGCSSKRAASYNMEIDIYIFFKLGHSPARGVVFKAPDSLDLNTFVRILGDWTDLKAEGSSHPDLRAILKPNAPVEVKRDGAASSTIDSEQVYLFVLEVCSKSDLYLKKLAQLERDLEYARIYFVKSRDFSIIPEKVAYAGLCMMVQPSYGVEFDILQIQNIICEFRGIFPRVYAMLRAGALLYIGHQNSLNTDVRRIARRLGEVQENVEGLQVQMRNLEENVTTQLQENVEGLQVQMRNLEENVTTQLQENVEGLQVQMRNLEEKVTTQLQENVEGLQVQMRNLEEKVTTQLQENVEGLQVQMRNLEEKVTTQLQKFQEEVLEGVQTKVDSLEMKLQSMITRSLQPLLGILGGIPNDE